MDRADSNVTSPPLEAFRFGANVAKLSPADADGRRKFEATFYTGDLIPNHWFWGNLVFDISTTKAADVTGCLLEHDPSKITGSGKCSFGADMKIEGLLSAKTDASKFVAGQADEGFPWQMSHFIEPGEIDQVKPGTKVNVNGREFTGPVTIFRHNFIRHVTFCADGADANTSAKVFTRQGNPSMPPTPPNTPATEPTVAELQAQVTQLSAQVTTITAERDSAREEGKAFRVERLRQIFKARGEDVSDEAKFAEKVKPFLAMSVEAFNAAMSLQPTGATQSRDPKLFSIEGAGNQEQPVPGQTGLVGKAQKFGAKTA